jgi:hypothetical protein
VLQSNSPQVDRCGADYLDGAEPGDFLLRGAVEPIRSGSAGFVAVPCGIRSCFMEWLPNRQGYAGRHDQEPGDVEVDYDGSRPIRIRSSNRNIIEETKELFLLIEEQPYLMPCTSTKIPFVKALNAYCGQFHHPKGGVLPSFAKRYLIRTVSTSNQKGHWFKPRFTDHGWVSEQEYAEAKALNAIVECDRVRGDYRGGTAAD